MITKKSRRPSRAEVERAMRDLQLIWRPPPEIKKIPEAVEAAQPGRITTFGEFYYIRCDHEHATLVRLDCRAGGTQYRKFCTTCWAPVGTAIPHALARAEETRTGVEAPIRRARSGGRP